jgi:hypothetical protein
VLTTLATVTQIYLGSSSSGLHLIIYGLAVVTVILTMPPGQGIIHPIMRLLGYGEDTERRQRGGQAVGQAAAHDGGPKPAPAATGKLSGKPSAGVGK